jgi:meso-butanediol dehydrogenase/(S,S)-butanediol dehydrogenase/diacetyl reductase
MIAVVTGAARGLGAAIAGRLAGDGAQVAYVDVCDQVEATAVTAREHGATTVAHTCDVSDEAAVERVMGAVTGQFGGLDLLVNCAGVGGSADAVAELSREDFTRTLEVNLTGSFLMARAAARAFAAGGHGGTIVNVGSLFGQQAAPHGAAYNASKAAIAALSQTLAQELGPAGVRVNTVAPGFMDTEMHFDELRARARRDDTTVDDELAAELATVPLRRLGSGADLAGVVAWLASPDAAYVTGQTIAVNGGVLMS